MSSERVEVGNTLGALLIGGLLASGFTGVVTTQTVIYLRLYPSDKMSLKSLAFTVWFLDICHTILISRTIWHELISHFGTMENARSLPWSLAFTIVNTAVLTIIVHCFFIYRIYILTEHNYFVSVPLAVLAFGRLAFACLATGQMITSHTLSTFVRKFTWTFTGDLVLSAVMDVIITVTLCLLLRRQQKKNPSSMDHIFDSLILYTLETGSLTCIATVLVLICWLAMPTNLVFMALYLVIIKLYANSLLATLNTRKQLQKGTSRNNTQGTVGTNPEPAPSETRGSRSGSIRKRSSETQV